MDDSFNVTHPTDWLHTPTPQLAQIEAALRCEVCKDFYDTPMITSCSHTFCSLCIRRCLTSDGKCPLCRAPDQELRLRRNWTVGELVEVFQVARPALIQLGKYQQVSTLKMAQGKAKRKLADSLGEESDGLDVPRIRRRDTLSRIGSGSLGQIHTAGVDPASEYRPEDGLTPCPICNHRMKEEDVFLHLDLHNDTDTTSRSESSMASSKKPLTGVSTKSPDRLPQLSYSLLKDNALRKKLAELGIPSAGPRALLIRRHTEWVNMVNANSDSARPRTKLGMLHELETWDRTQGRQVSNIPGEQTNSSSIMRKDFDGKAWASRHDADFQKLISDAREKLGKANAERDGIEVEGSVISGHELEDQQTASREADQRDDLSGDAFSPDPIFHPIRQSSDNNDEAISTNSVETPVTDLDAVD